jgi:hypothetical protein
VQSGREKWPSLSEVENIQASVWVGFVQDAEKLKEDDFEKETATDGVLQPVVVNRAKSDSAVNKYG